MTSQNLYRDFEETLQTQTAKSHPQLFAVASASLPQVVGPKNKNQKVFLPFKVSETIRDMTTNRSIHD
jgi:hypothetical protein